MKSAMRFRVVLVLAAMALVANAGLISRPRLQAWTRARLAQRLLEDIAAQREDQAARLVRELDQDEPEWLVVFVAALADKRPAVAAAGQTALVDAVERWQRASLAVNSSRVAILAGLLADHAPRLAPERVAVAQGLALQLLAWPIDGRRADAARLIADCEKILALAQPELADIRLAAMPESVPEVAEQNTAIVPAPAAEIAPMETAIPIEATRESPTEPNEPRRLASPQAIRITDR
jgi:hypothetical protein